MDNQSFENPNKSYMEAVLEGVTDDTLVQWCSEQNIAQHQSRNFAGFEIVDKLDGGKYPEREVSLVRITQKGVYPQHIHKESDALFYIKSGSALFLSGKSQRKIQTGDKIEIPRGTPHGFELTDGETLEFLSIQSPPIKNTKTGEEDFYLTDIV